MIMKVGELDMKCGNCPIIDYCNDFEDTPPCAQPRFQDINVNDYLEVANIADYSKMKTKDDMVDAIYEALEGSE